MIISCVDVFFVLYGINNVGGIYFGNGEMVKIKFGCNLNERSIGSIIDSFFFSYSKRV